jgi:hypothetical protein
MRTAVLALMLCCSTLTAAVTIPEFFGRRDYRTAPGNPIVEDVAGDGIPDIIVVPLEDVIIAMVGNGYGGFSAAVNTTVDWGFIDGEALVDLNGDGRADLIISGMAPAIGATPTGGAIGVMFSNGDGTFQPPVNYRVNTSNWDPPWWETSMATEYRTPSLLARAVSGCSQDEGVEHLTGRTHADNSVPAPQSQPYWGPLAAADFNGDGNLDVAVATNPNGVPAYGLYVLFGNGNGTFQAPVLIANNISSPNFVAAATTRDGYTDIVDPGGSIYLNNGKGRFAGPVEVSISGPAIAVGDVNGHGIPDLASSSGCVAYGEGETKFTAQRCYPVANTGSSRNVTLAELTKGKPGFNDIIAGEGSLVSVLLNEGNGAFVDGVWTPYRALTTAVRREPSMERNRWTSWCLPRTGLRFFSVRGRPPRCSPRARRFRYRVRVVPLPRM